MIEKPLSHYKEDFEHACTELKRQDSELWLLRKRVGEKNLEIAGLKAQAAELECMVKVFRGCIDTRIFPLKGSPCHKIVWDLVGEPDDDRGDYE